MSSRVLRIAMIVLCTLGLGVASYVTYVHYSGAQPLCTGGGSCLQVQTSVYSKLAGVPVALIGLIGYIAILASLLVPQNETTRMATAALTVIGFAFSAYLTYRELFSIHAICEWCVSSAVIMTVLACLAVWRFLRGAPPDLEYPSPAAHPVGSAQQPGPLAGQALTGHTGPDGAAATQSKPLTIN
jgi:uncharacterized membrane protein